MSAGSQRECTVLYKYSCFPIGRWILEVFLCDVAVHCVDNFKYQLWDLNTMSQKEQMCRVGTTTLGYKSRCCLTVIDDADS